MKAKAYAASIPTAANKQSPKNTGGKEKEKLPEEAADEEKEKKEAEEKEKEAEKEKTSISGELICAMSDMLKEIFSTCLL